MAPLVARRDSRRSFFTLFSKPPREIKPFDVGPGWEEVVKWRTAVLEDTRPPPRAHLVKAFRIFFDFKIRHALEVNSSQATALRLLLQYLALNEADEAGPGLGLQELATARRSLLRLPRDADNEHLELARAIYKDLKRLRQLESGERPEQAMDGGLLPSEEKNPAAQDFAIHIALLTQYGASTEATEALQLYVQKLTNEGRLGSEGISRGMLLDISRGLARERREDELCKHMAGAETAGCGYDRDFHEVMTVFYAKKGLTCTSEGDVVEALVQTKSWFDKPISGDGKPTAATYRAILELGLRAGDKEWLARELQRPLSRPNPPEPSVCDAIVQWSMSTQGGFRKVGPVMKVICRKFEASGGSHVWPTVATTNSMLKVATRKNDEELVKEILTFAESKNILPDPMTYVTLINWLLDTDQPLRAIKTYREMRDSQEPTDADIPATNRLIRELCISHRPPLDAIAKLVIDLEQRYSIIDPETVSRLVRVYLERDHPLDAIDVLSISIGHFSSEQQKMVQDTITAYFFDSVSMARAWDAYQILQQYFANMDGGTRRRIMSRFFSRGRPDMAVAALKHMRKHADAASRPDIDAYADFFESLGLCAMDDDGATLKTAHNLLKLDARVQPSTRLYNALMMAYGSATTTHAFLDLWTDLTRSAEGPSYASLEIVFWGCARRFWGAQPAKKIWAKLATMDVDITPAVYVRYASAVGHGEGNAHEAMQLLEQMPEVVGEGPDVWALGIVHNYLSAPQEQELFAKWAKVKHPAAWKDLEQHKQRLTYGDLRLFLVPDILKT